MVREGLEGALAPTFAKVIFRERRLLRPSLPSPEENAAPLAKTLSGSLGPRRSPRRACVGVLARDLPAHREAVVWRGETLLLDPRRRWEVV
jgi:hypothetical protein